VFELLLSPFAPTGARQTVIPQKSGRSPRSQQAFVVPPDSGLDGDAWTAPLSEREASAEKAKRADSRERVKRTTPAPKKRPRSSAKKVDNALRVAPAPPAAAAAVLPQQIAPTAAFPIGMGGAPFFPHQMVPQAPPHPGSTIINNYYVSYVLPGPAPH
jgi:hypothetical protein